MSKPPVDPCLKCHFNYKRSDGFICACQTKRDRVKSIRSWKSALNRRILKAWAKEWCCQMKDISTAYKQDSAIAAEVAYTFSQEN